MTWESILKLSLPEEYNKLARKYGGSASIRDNIITVDFINDDNARNYTKHMKELLLDQMKTFRILGIGQREGYHRVKIEVG